jgi:hydroxyacylglutathione hydrolase
MAGCFNEEQPMLEVIAIPARQDNYIWLIKKGQQAVVVDPGDAGPVLGLLQQERLHLAAILLTHHHRDHTEGVRPLMELYPEAVCYGPAFTLPGLPCYHPLADHAELSLPTPGLTFKILHLPGHTEEHIAYYGHGALFCGDVLFGAGCGRLLNGTAEQMYHSLQRIKQLPPDTQIYPAHEYTQANLEFCLLVEPDNTDSRERFVRCQKLRQQGLPTLPGNLAEEMATNVFLRTDQLRIRRWAEQNALCICKNEIQVFAILREKKNNL